jgi:hypothetical protein
VELCLHRRMLSTPILRARLTPVVALAVGLGLTLLPQSAAHAEAVTSHDAARDVVRVTRQHPAASDPDPAVAFGDLTALRIRYGPTRIFGVMHFRRLNHSRTFGINVELKYKDAIQFRYPQVVIGVRHGHWQGHLTWDSDDPDHSAACKVTHRINYRRDLIALSFPVACINAPRWVAARVLASSKKSPGVFDTDDLPDQHRTVGTYGPRVHQG